MSTGSVMCTLKELRSGTAGGWLLRKVRQMSNEHYLQITSSRDMGGGNLAVNVWHWAPGTGGWTGVDTTATANTIIGYIKSFLDACNAQGIWGGQVIGATVIEYEFNEAPKYVPATAQVATDTGTGAIQPLQLAACVSWRTALAGRSYRGRTFLGPLRLSAITGSTLTGTFVSAVNTAATTYAGRTAGTFRPVVMSKTGTIWHKTGDHEYSPSFHTGFTTAITSGSTTAAVRTMRSRA